MKANGVPVCRGCAVPLTRANARRSRHRWVGVCRRCEALTAREKWRAAHPGARVDHARRKVA